MTIVEVAKGQAMIIAINELGDLQDPDSKETLKFELENHDAVHDGAFPVYKATAKDGRVYTAELRGEVRVLAGEKPDPYAQQKAASEDRNMFIEGKQTPDKFAKTDEELGFDLDAVSDNESKKSTSKKK